MALLSPGVQVSVIDQSNYTPAAAGSVPFILLATAQNKVSGAGTGIAPGTLAANAGEVYLMTSQRDLLSTFGVPFFYNTTAGTPINGYELNEYGLLAAYSALGVTNLAYVMRADIDLAALTASLTRPTQTPANGTYWLDTTNSTWGINQWNISTNSFTVETPSVITDTAYLETSTTVPVPSYGSIGNYAVVATNEFNPLYYKRGGPTSAQAPGWLQDSLSADDLYNTWVQVGTDYWHTAWPAVTGSTNPTSLPAGSIIEINGVQITIPSSPNNTVTGLVTAINALSNSTLPGVYAANISGKLNIYGDSGATSAAIAISNYMGTPLTTLGIVAGTYSIPVFQYGYNYQAPLWSTGQTNPAPTGSVFQQINAVNQGMLIEIKKYNSALGQWVLQACPGYIDENQALYSLDPVDGGYNIPLGTTYARVDANGNTGGGANAAILILERGATGATVATGTVANPTFTSGSTFTITATQPGTTQTTTLQTITISGTTSADFVAAVSAAQIPNVSAQVNSAGEIVFTQALGGDIFLTDGTYTPLATAGFTVNTPFVRGTYSNFTLTGLIISNWVGSPQFVYTASTTAPSIDPATGTYWYYSDATEADIMIQYNGAWYGYQTVTKDSRGYNLSMTYPGGPIFSTTAPTTWPDSGQSQLQLGDLWINTGDLENYPVISRWQSVNGQDQWVQINNADSTTSNGILFADARWSYNGAANPITDPLPPIANGTTTALINQSYVDLDAPNPALYAQGTLLWNTRRSGFNVKSFEANAFNSTDYPGQELPPVAATWNTASPNNVDGTPNMGRHAQRVLIVKALRSAIDTSTQLREQQAQFNLIACPQYPELAPNMVVLNNDRGDTGFNVVDTPLRLTPDEVVAWATNAGVYTNYGSTSTTTLYGEGNLAAGDPYSGAFYPSCTTTDLSGNTVVTAPSHMMLRTIIRSDAVAYPWFAPAGLRRGVVDNALQIGYLQATTGNFITTGVSQGLRDTLYQNDINPITYIPGTGIVNFGNHTLQGLNTALDRINVARLVAYLRGRLEIIGNQYLFEPNDTITRSSIQGQINSLMVDLVGKRALYDYLVVCDTTNNTPATIDANELYVDIAIEPVKAVEFIYIPMRIQNTGTIAAQATA